MSAQADSSPARCTSLQRLAPTLRQGLLMAFKLLLIAQERWRRMNAAWLVPLVRAGVVLRDGERAKRQERAHAA